MTLNAEVADGMFYFISFLSSLFWFGFTFMFFSESLRESLYRHVCDVWENIS